MLVGLADGKKLANIRLTELDYNKNKIGVKRKLLT